MGDFLNPAFDIANHFCEFAGLELDWTRLPSDASKREWLAAYFVQRGIAEVVDLGKWMGAIHDHELLSHCVWYLWANLQHAFRTNADDSLRLFD